MQYEVSKLSKNNISLNRNQVFSVIGLYCFALGTSLLGFSVYLHKRSVRIAGIDTPESRINLKKYPERAKEKELGLLAKARLKEYLRGQITVKSYGTDKYGRILGDLYCERGNVADLLKSEKLAVDYDGGTKTKVWL